MNMPTNTRYANALLIIGFVANQVVLEYDALVAMAASYSGCALSHGDDVASNVPRRPPRLVPSTVSSTVEASVAPSRYHLHSAV